MLRIRWFVPSFVVLGTVTRLSTTQEVAQTQVLPAACLSLDPNTPNFVMFTAVSWDVVA